jgi:hypothetical protein
MQDWITKSKWFYDNCIVTPGGDYACFPAYSVAGLVLLCIVAFVVLLIARRAFTGWKEEQRNRLSLLARKEVAPPEVMDQFTWKGDASAGSDLSYQQLVEKFKAGKAEVRSHNDDPGHKRCPDCRELIRTDAKVCRHCGYRFDAR